MSEIIVSDKLDDVSPSFCLAKWNMVSLHLTNGKTHSCYHNPVHDIPLTGLQENPSLLHNTPYKVDERKQMREGEKPSGCSYCWRIEDEGHKSDRHYRADEWWNSPDFYKIKDEVDIDKTITPAYVEVNFNQTCNFKCIYCSPHLSSTWEEEIEKYGPYNLTRTSFNNISMLKEKGLMPLKTAQKDNPYVQAFWKWWPDIYSNLKIFRMTGGEPLVDHNTWKVLDYCYENPNENLEISITSNLCPPKVTLFDKLITQVKKLETLKPGRFAPQIKFFNLFVSLDSVGKQAEYIRNGLDFETLVKNVDIFLSHTNGTSVTFINTFNVLSIPKFYNFLEYILKLRKKYNRKYQIQNAFRFDVKRETYQRINFDVPILTTPTWLNIRLLAGNNQAIDALRNCVLFMEENLVDDNYVGFYQYEIDKVKRDLDILVKGRKAQEAEADLVRLCDYVDELDKRRGTNFLQTFPEYHTLYMTHQKKR